MSLSASLHCFFAGCLILLVFLIFRCEMFSIGKFLEFLGGMFASGNVIYGIVWSFSSRIFFIHSWFGMFDYRNISYVLGV